MQGNIRVESREGEGSRFIVTLNIRILEEEERQEEAVQRAVTGNLGRKLDACLQGLRLLLVEDNELNMEIAETLLGCGLYRCQGRERYEAFQMFVSSEPGTYDAILMDYRCR